MAESPRDDVTRCLEAAARGDGGATDELLVMVYDELRRVAASLMRPEPGGAVTLQPTALVHEAYLRLLGPGGTTWENRAHFFGAAARAMRRILVERARQARAANAGRRRADTLPPEQMLPASDAAPSAGDPSDLIGLDGALEKLRRRDERQHEVVMLRYFAGLTIEQTAEVMELSLSTVKNEWMYARAWLLREIDTAGSGRP